MKITKSVSALEAEIEKLHIEVAELRHLVALYEEKFKIAQHRRFGASSEKNPFPNQLELFNETEVCASGNSSESDQDLEETIVSTKRKKRKGKRDELYANPNLSTEKKVYELPENEQTCPKCGGKLRTCGHEVLRRELKVIPATIKVLEHIQTLYSCHDCYENSTGNSRVKAKVPAPVIPKSGIASPSLLAFVLSNKYVLALPLSRQEQEFKRQDIFISRQTMANWCIYAAEHWLKPIFDLLHASLLACDILHADETRIQVITEPNRKASTNSYMWVYQSGLHEKDQVVLFDYSQTRVKANPLEFLSGFSGYLIADGYQGYYALEAKEVTLCGCFAHARRKFVDVLKTVEKPLKKGHPAAKGVQYCDKLFKLEHGYDERRLTPHERHERRQVESKPVAEAFFAWATEVLPSLPDKSKMREAVVYALNQQSRLIKFLLDGRIEISNNRVERSVRPFAIGRNNWIFAYCPEGAQASAIIYSIVETAKANGLVPFKYLEHLFKTLPNIPKESFSDCLPWNPTVQEICKSSDPKK